MHHRRINETDRARKFRKKYQPPVASRAILGFIPNLIHSNKARTLYYPPPHPAKIICRLPGGQIYYESQLAVDTDGPRKANIKYDRTHLDHTAWEPHNKPVDSNNIPYISIKEYIYRYLRSFGVRKGDVAAVIYNDKLAFAVLADIGGDRLGEGSLELHRELGHERVKNNRVINAGIPGSVITIIFPGSHTDTIAAMTAKGNPQAIRDKGKQLFEGLILQSIQIELLPKVVYGIKWLSDIYN